MCAGMTGTTQQAADKLKTAAVVSIAVAAAVLGLKFLAYWRTGSVALYSDALESIVNVITAVIALYTIHVALQPADRRHPVRPSQGRVPLCRDRGCPHHRRRPAGAARGLRCLDQTAQFYRPLGWARVERTCHRPQRRVVCVPDPLGAPAALASPGGRRLALADGRGDLGGRADRLGTGHCTGWQILDSCAWWPWWRSTSSGPAGVSCASWSAA